MPCGLERAHAHTRHSTPYRGGLAVRCAVHAPRPGQHWGYLGHGSAPKRPAWPGGSSKCPLDPKIHHKGYFGTMLRLLTQHTVLIQTDLRFAAQCARTLAACLLALAGADWPPRAQGTCPAGPSALGLFGPQNAPKCPASPYGSSKPFGVQNRPQGFILEPNWGFLTRHTVPTTTGLAVRGAGRTYAYSLSLSPCRGGLATPCTGHVPGGPVSFGAIWAAEMHQNALQRHVGPQEPFGVQNTPQGLFWSLF